MGNTSSRPRPNSSQHIGPQFSDSYPPPVHHGPQFFRLQNSNFNAPAPHNGQFYGGYPGARPGPAPYPGSQNPTPSGPVADKQLTQTATIRNAVNVKKQSLTLTPLPGAPNKLALTFTFDASQPCMVTIFFAATESVNEACKLTTSKQAVLPGVFYEKGLGLNYPKEGAVGAVIDLGKYNETELKSSQEGQYPLVIRLETVSEKALAEGHSLSELQAGGPQKVWVQSQTTFANLAKDEHDAWQVRTLKQKIWVEGTSYELQEIYGMEQATAAAKDRTGIATPNRTAEQEEERLCVICLVNERDTTVLPCRHMCMCHECAQELRKQTSKCPICRNHVESLLHIRMTRQQAPKSAATPVDQSTVQAALEKLRITKQTA